MTKEEGGGTLSGRKEVGHYAGNRIVLADCRSMAAIDIGGIVAAVAVCGRSGGSGDVNACVLA